MPIDPHTRTGWFKLDQHKNVNKGFETRGKLADRMVEDLLSIPPGERAGALCGWWVTRR